MSNLRGNYEIGDSDEVDFQFTEIPDHIDVTGLGGAGLYLTDGDTLTLLGIWLGRPEWDEDGIETACGHTFRRRPPNPLVP